MFGGVLDRLAAAVVDRRFELGRVATEPLASNVDGTRGGSGNMTQRGDQSMVGQDPRMDSTGDFAQLADRLI